MLGRCPPPNELVLLVCASMPSGKPAFIVMTLLTCHPPNTAFVAPFQRFPTFFPFPKGNSAIKLITTLWGTSFASTDFSAARLYQARTELAAPETHCCSPCELSRYFDQVYEASTCTP